MIKYIYVYIKIKSPQILVPIPRVEFLSANMLGFHSYIASKSKNNSLFYCLILMEVIEVINKNC